MGAADAHDAGGFKAKVGAADTHDASSPGGFKAKVGAADAHGLARGFKAKVGAADAHDVVMRARQGVQGQSGPKWEQLMLMMW